MTQGERVLRELRRQAGRGVTAWDFCGPSVIDGGPRIMRVGARILELKRAGHAIVKAGRRDGHDVYVLREPPVFVVGSIRTVGSIRIGAPARSIYDPYSEAA